MGEGSTDRGQVCEVPGDRVYLEDNAMPILVVKWKGKTAQELADSVEFFKDVVTGKNMTS